MEKIKLIIANDEYNISTDNDLDYVAQLGEELNQRITSILNSSTRISVTQAAILTALEYADAAKKGEVVEEPKQENAPLSGVADRPNCKGRNYDPNRYKEN